MVNVDSHFSKNLDDALIRAVEALRPPPIETLPEWIECCCACRMASHGPAR
jgi:hypothetical protein